MGELQPGFNGRVADEFVDQYYGSVRGHVRQEVVRLNILEHIIDNHHLQVADIGAGDGRDGVWLAGMGHTVTAVERSPDMVAKAPSITEYLDVVQGTASTLLEQGRAGTYDLVLSHCVVMYNLENPEEDVEDLVKLLKPGGKLSFLSTNYNARLIDTEDKQALEELRASGQYVNKLSERAKAFTIPETRRMLEGAGASVVDWYGVRIHTEKDKRSIKDLSEAHMKWLIDQEYSIGRDRHQRGLAQMHQFIVQKPTV